jgi:hypothetical protein
MALLCLFSIKHLYILYQKGMAHQDMNAINKMGGVVHTLVSNEHDSAMSTESHTLDVKFEIPTENEDCAICMDKIGECEVTGFEMLSFDPSRPWHKKIILPCAHFFSANAVLVHWLTSSMRCPLCRAGVDGTMCIGNLPEEWKIPANTYVDQHKQEQIEAIDREAADIAASIIAQDLVIHNRFIHVSMHALLVTNSGTVHRIPLNFSQAVDQSTGDFWMRVTRADVRQVSSIINKSGCYAMTVSVYSHDTISGENGLEIVARGCELANSGVMRLPHAFHGHTAAQATDFGNTGHVTVARPGQSVSHPSTAGDSAFNLRWFYQNNRMLDALINIEYRINMNSLMTFVAHGALQNYD